ncbi:MAG: hypothetical protein V1652_02955 [bacterium]
MNKTIVKKWGRKISDIDFNEWSILLMGVFADFCGPFKKSIRGIISTQGMKYQEIPSIYCLPRFRFVQQVSLDITQVSKGKDTVNSICMSFFSSNPHCISIIASGKEAIDVVDALLLFHKKQGFSVKGCKPRYIVFYRKKIDLLSKANS